MQPPSRRYVDLSDIARKSTRLRHDHPDLDVVADIEVVIAPEAASARAMLSLAKGESDTRTLLYVGTPAGLAGLITDIHVLGIADGAVLIPRAPGVADLIRDAVMPVLRSMTGLPAAVAEARPA